MKRLFGFFLVIVLAFIQSTFAQCNYEQTVVPGQTYQLFSPNYSYNYAAGQSCSWVAIAPPGYKLVLNCPVVQIPCQDTFVINQYGSLSDTPTGNNKICGTGTINMASLTNMISVRLRTTTNGGKFFCTFTTQNDPCACGRQGSARIVGGTPAQVHEFPYQALLTDKSRYPVCGAALIAEKYALTAAHCVIGRTISNTDIVVGEHDRSVTSDTPYTAIYPIASLIRHASYSSSTGMNDIALVKTYTAFQWNRGVGIACLPFLYNTSLFTGYSVTVAGWGTTSFGGALSNVLLKAYVNVISNTQCAADFPQASSNNFMCTFTPGKDTCQYDSGTNAFVNINGRMYSLGIVSGGKGCASSPALNTRVTQYLPWILANSQDATYCSL